MQQEINQAAAFIATLTGNAETVMDFRAINENDKSVPAIPRRGTLAQHWPELCQWNGQGYGIYVTIAATDGVGREKENVTGFRANYIDLDGIGADQQFTNAQAWSILPTMAVQSSPGKWHVYWVTAPHNDTALQERIQRKLVTKFNADVTVIDAPRIMRLPGTFHCKGDPVLVQCYSMAGMGQTVIQAEQLDLTMWDVMPSQAGGTGDRIAVGEGERAPSTQEAVNTLFKIECANMTDRNQWAAISGAYMQAVDPADMEFALSAYLQWNEGYPGNDPEANIKLWNDTLERGTSVKGWSRLHKEATGLTPQQARLLSGAGSFHPSTPSEPVSMSSASPAPVEVDTSGFGPILDPQECSQWFAGCYAITSENVILCRDNIQREAGKFNTEYGGKAFVITQDGKTTDEPWKAATRSQLWMVPKVAFTCFRPDLPDRATITDGLRRKYVNTYVPADIDNRPGDITPFLNHLEKLFPVENDRRILIEWLAHNVKYPGHKIPWAPLIQGGEGIGKNVFKYIMQNAMNKVYFYQPKAKQLADSGAKFNGWMEAKLFFLVDEVKTDDKREMMETLKPFISELELEIEGKGSDQRMGDTPGNWLFFSNWKDALPITLNTRRHCILYSVLQDLDDLRAAGFGDVYLTKLYDWILKEGGAQFVTHYLLNYPIERGALPVRAPHTSSTHEAIAESRGWLEDEIMVAVDCELDGFKNGWVATAAIARVLTKNDHKRMPAGKTMAHALKNLGYHKIGQAGRGYFNDNPEKADQRSNLWNKNKNEQLMNYPLAQSYLF